MYRCEVTSIRIVLLFYSENETISVYVWLFVVYIDVIDMLIYTKLQ